MRKMSIIQRNLKMLEMRKGGTTLQAIAEKFGLSRTRVMHIIRHLDPKVALIWGNGRSK